MSDTKVRVHTLAKELCVTSKAIIDKCAAEGIAIKNHMHVLSAGLEATIREWFSEAAQQAHTAIEDAGPVDLGKVRAKRSSVRKTKKTAKAAEPVLAAEAGVTAVAEEAAPVGAPPAEELRPAALVEAPPSVGVLEAAAEATPETAEPIAPPLVAAEAPAAAAQMGPVAPAPPTREKVVVAGPQNIPAPAQLQGPRVVRIDRPETVDRPRPAARGPWGAPPSPGLPPGGTDVRRPRGVPGRGRDDEEDAAERAKSRGPGTGGSRHRTANPRRTTGSPAIVGELLREWRDRDLIERRERLDHVSGRGISGMRADETTKTPRGVSAPRPKTVRRDKIQLTEPILIKQFCAATGIAFSQVFRKLQEFGILASLNQAIESETAQLMAMEHGLEIEIIKAKSALDRLREAFAERPRKHLKPRPPVVTVLGHVDHGKTSLLDRIRSANVVSGEAGGITQHIGAYRARVEDRYVTFLDTPGHAAFTAMRARGARMTDVAVLVVAADDGVMPQTIEAINHARAAGVPIVVALNKIDLPQSDPNKVFGQLAEQQLIPQQWGGDTDVIPTSATTGEGIDELLRHLAALSELLDLKADPTLPAMGVVVEAQRDDRQGPIARILIQDGTLKTGDVVVCGGAHGRIRAMRDDAGRPVQKAEPAMPVEVLGLDDVPEAGDSLYVVGNLAQAKEIALETANERREASLIKVAKPTTLESLLAERTEGEVPELNVIVKADVQGSVDVLKKALSEIPTSEVKLNILHAGVGNVNESDITLAAASQAIVIGFHVAPDPAIQRLADERGVDIRLYKIIYNVTDEIRNALEGLLTPTEKIESRGRAEVRQVFKITRAGTVAGCYIVDGVIARNHTVRVLRDGVPVREGAALASLKRFKDDAREVRAGLECGIRIEGFDDVKPGDVIESYEVTKVARTL